MKSAAGLAPLLLVLLGAPAVGVAAPAPLRGLAVDESLAGPPLLADVIARLPAASTLPLIARIAVDVAPFERDAADWLERLDQRVGRYRARNIPVVLAVGALPASDDRTEAWRVAVRAIVERERGRIAAVQVGAADADALPGSERYAFLLKLAAVQIRSIDADAAVIAGPVPASAAEWLQDVFARATGSYLNAVSVSGGPDRLDAIAAAVEKEVPEGYVVWAPRADPVRAAIEALGTNVRVTVVPERDQTLATVLASAAHVADLLAADLVPLDEGAAALRFTNTRGVPHRLLYSVSGAGTYLVYGPVTGATTVDVDVTVANAGAPTVRDPVAGTATAVRVDRADANRLHLSLPVAPYPLVLDFSYGAANEYALTSEAQQEALPRVEEIIFRYQQVQAAQDAALRAYVANVRIEQHFHPTPADPAYNVVTDNRMFADRGGVEWEELSFRFNGAKWGADRPAFPLLQAEKVLSLPLDLRLNQDYLYRLDGVDTVNGRAAFAVRFDPVDASRALYRGTVWIDRRSSVRLKVQAVETHLTGAIVSNEETQTFARAGEIGGRDIWLFDRLDSRQVFLIAGRTVLVERAMHVTDVRLNPAEFEDERAAARASDRIMYRDTDAGLRYFVRKGDTRVVSAEMTRSAKAFALGADVDPSLDYPLPIGGLDILDFNFLNRDVQFALLYGGVIGMGNLQKANLWGGKFDVSVDFFGLAVKSNDSVFDEAGERRAERVLKMPASTGLNVGYQLSPFQKVSGHYELRYDAYFSDAQSAPGFQAPASGFTHGEGVGYEYRRRGYSLTGNAAAYQRSTWTAWGFPGTFDAATRTYLRYDAGVSKDFVLATFHTIHLNGTYFGGERLDRFSAYAFGLFDPARMHGVPSAVRFGELAMFRGSYSFNVFDRYRFDLFVDHATGRDPDRAGPWRRVTGLGVGLNFRGPRSTIVRADVGRSLLPDVYRGAGSTVVQIMVLKPL